MINHLIINEFLKIIFRKRTYIGFLLIFPVTRKFLFKKIYKKKISTDENKKKDFIEGEFEDKDEK